MLCSLLYNSKLQRYNFAAKLLWATIVAAILIHHCCICCMSTRPMVHENHAHASYMKHGMSCYTAAHHNPGRGQLSISTAYMQSNSRCTLGYLPFNPFKQNQWHQHGASKLSWASHCFHVLLSKKHACTASKYDGEDSLITFIYGPHCQSSCVDMGCHNKMTCGSQLQ